MANGQWPTYMVALCCTVNPKTPEACAGDTARQRQLHPAPSHGEHVWGHSRTWGGGEPSQKWLVDSWPSQWLHTLLKRNIYNKDIICWANVLCSRQEAGCHMGLTSLSLHRVLIFHTWGNWGTEGLCNLSIITQLNSGGTRIWTQAMLLLESLLLNLTACTIHTLSCYLSIKYFKGNSEHLKFSCCPA